VGPEQLALQMLASAQISEPGQTTPVPGLHVPAPSQILGVNVAEAQVEPQFVPVATNRQAPAPSQVPSCPHGVLSTAQVLCAFTPAAAGRQYPV